MVIIKGKTYSTIADAARTFAVSAKTIRSYIDRGIIPDPPRVQYGLRVLRHFPGDYMKEARRLLNRYRLKKTND